MYVEITAVGPYETARIALQPDGTVLLFSSIMPVGQGSETTQRQLVAEELGVAMEQVAIRQGDTDEVPDAVGTFASRGAAVGGAAGRMAARELIKTILHCFAAALKCDPAALRWESGGVILPEPDAEFVPLPEIPSFCGEIRCRRKSRPLIGSKFPGRPIPTQHTSPWWKSIRKRGGSKFRATPSRMIAEGS